MSDAIIRLSLAAIVASLLPHLDTLDFHLRVVPPSRQPLVFGLPEIELSTRTMVDPRLATLAIFEPAVRPTNRQVEHEVKVLIKGRRVALGTLPGIVQTGPVGVGEREAAVLPERLVKVRVHDL